MNNLSIQTKGDEMVIRLNRSGFNDNYLLSMIRRLHLEELAKKANFNDDILEIAEDIDQKWWNKNGEEFLKNVK